MAFRLKSVLGNLLAGGDSVPLNPRTRMVATLLAVPLAVFEFWLAFIGLVTPIQLGLIFVVPLIIIAFLTTSGVTGRNETSPFDVIFAVLVAIAGSYLLWESPRFGNWILGISR